MEEKIEEQTTETQEEATQPEVQETPPQQEKAFKTQEQVNSYLETRLAKERRSVLNKLGVEDLDTAINAVKTQKDLAENKSLLSSASKNKAINPDQVVSLLQPQIKLNDEGNVEILDSKGLARYNSNGELFTTDELVQEFLTQNPHFVGATPSGSGTVSNVDRQELNKPLDVSALDMNNPEDRKKYAEYRKQRDSKPRSIVVNN